MIFKIQNLGAVKEAEIDLSKDLILLCGHNNTGKTYVAYAIGYLLQLDIIDFCINFLDKVTLSKILDIDNEINVLIQKKKLKLNIFSLAEKVLLKQDLFNYLFQFYINGFSTFFNYENFDKLKVDLKVNINSLKESILFQSFYEDFFDDIISQKEKNSEFFLFEIPYTIKKKEIENYKDEIETFTNTLKEDILEIILKSIFHLKVHIATAERSAINIFNTELSLIKNKVLQAVLKDNSLTELAQRRVNRYPQPIRDSLELSQDLKLLSQKISELSYLSDELERTILKGKITVGEYGELLYSPLENPDMKLEMHVSSSLVKSLASISFYLRHIAKKGDCIIIDEPELNLHPDNQILVARFLARLVNEGFKVIASTHSDYIIREINNLIMLGKDDKKAVKLRKKHKYSEKEVLRHEQVQALLFKRKKGEEKVVGENLTVSETGLAIETIDEVIEDLENRTEDIYFNLFEQ